MSVVPICAPRVREMPQAERPRERLVGLGPEALRNGELLAVLFRTGSRRESAVALGDSVMAHFGTLRGLARASVDELKSVDGLGDAKAIEIKAALELGKRLAAHVELDRYRIHDGEDVAKLMMIKFKDCETEQFKCLLLNAKNELLRVVDISQGTIDGTSAMPRDVFRQAVREAAAAVIVCHNHPSGDPEPSREDISITERLRRSAELLGVRMLDHVIFGDGRYVSMGERGLL